MKTKKALLFFGCIIVGMLLYVFGAMYMANKDQSGGGSASANSSNANTQTGAATNNSPGNNGSAQAQGSSGNQPPNPSGTVQGSFTQQAPMQNVVAPTQTFSAPRQTSGGSNGTSEIHQSSLQQQSQNNSVNNSQPQITQNPIGGL